MPSDIIQNTDAGKATAVVSWTEPTATDNSGVQTMTSSHKPGDVFNIGITNVSYTSTDGAANMATSTFSVTIQGASYFAFENTFRLYSADGISYDFKYTAL